ncbi:MAG: helix-turn-helix transcriptional regulator [Phycisphaerae bacterium]|nr:helix-turn-helix transcriptional regulator [Phycisphaerae bacterium]
MQFERELLKGVLPLAVLKLLRHREMYGYELVKEVTERSGGILKLGQSTLYPLLYNLEAQGLIESEWREADSGRGRKYYRLTDAGTKRLDRDLLQWDELVRGMGRLVVGGLHSRLSTLLS